MDDMPQPEPPGEGPLPVHHARGTTDARLRTEREEANRLLAAKLAEEERKMARARSDTDESLTAERRLSDAILRRRDDVLALISHDLRNFVNALGLKASLLLQHLAPGDQKAKNLAGDIHRGCQTITRWAQDLVDVSTLDAGKLAVRPVVGDAVEIVCSAAGTFSDLAARKQISLEVDVPVEDPRPSCRCDRGRTLQVLTNLLDNAIKFTSPPGQILLRLSRVDGTVTFSVTDTGPGIAPEDRERIFERYWHGGRGSGLGLFICRQIVEDQGGRIWVESTPGRGTTFFVSLPTR
jgi:signal transduction histidine kinase